MSNKDSSKCVVLIPDIYSKGSRKPLTATLYVEHHVGTEMYTFSMETDEEETEEDSQLEQDAIEFYQSLQGGYSRFYKDLFYVEDSTPLSLRFTALGTNPGGELDRILEELGSLVEPYEHDMEIRTLKVFRGPTALVRSVEPGFKVTYLYYNDHDGIYSIRFTRTVHAEATTEYDELFERLEKVENRAYISPYSLPRGMTREDSEHHNSRPYALVLNAGRSDSNINVRNDISFAIRDLELTGEDMLAEEAEVLDNLSDCIGVKIHLLLACLGSPLFD
jgi:hypothetical protein